MNPTHGPRAWSLDDRWRLRAGGREQWTVLSGTSTIGHGLHVADRGTTVLLKCCTFLLLTPSVEFGHQALLVLSAVQHINQYVIHGFGGILSQVKHVERG